MRSRKLIPAIIVAAACLVGAAGPAAARLIECLVIVETYQCGCTIDGGAVYCQRKRVSCGEWAFRSDTGTSDDEICTQ